MWLQCWRHSFCGIAAVSWFCGCFDEQMTYYKRLKDNKQPDFNTTANQGPVSRKSRLLFGLGKLFYAFDVYLKTQILLVLKAEQ